MKQKPLSQQRTALSRSNNRPEFGYFMEQGTGKSFVGLADAESLFLSGSISLLVIVAPAGVQRQWIEEQAPEHLSIPFRTLLWTPNHTKRWMSEATRFDRDLGPGSQPTLRILALNVEAFSMKKGKAEKFLTALIKRHPTIMLLDESSTIKNPTSQRTKNLIRVGRYAAFKRILTGTPITQSPLNYYSQFDFLKPALLGFDTYTPFKAFYAEWKERVISVAPTPKNPSGKRKFPELVRYRNQSILRSRANQHSYTITKAECLDLKPKVYEKRFVEMSPAQSRLYTEALTALILQINSDDRMTLAHAFTRLTRLSQICGGFVKPDEHAYPVAIPGVNPKIDSLQQFVDEFPDDRKLIIWARYVPEMLAINNALGASNCALYYGDISNDERAENIERFKRSPQVRFFVGNQKVGKFGFNFAEYCQDMLYFSNDFSAEARWQSEDRIHRIGQAGTCTYTDLTIPGTIDTKILAILLERKEMADFFKREDDDSDPREALLEWLQS